LKEILQRKNDRNVVVMNLNAQEMQHFWKKNCELVRARSTDDWGLVLLQYFDRSAIVSPF